MQGNKFTRKGNNMPSFDMTDALAGRWMSQHDIDDEGKILKIKKVTREEVGDDQTDKFALHFAGDHKPLLLNKTNIRVLVELYGSKSDEWVDKPIHVYLDENVSYGGKRVGGLRLKKVKASKPMKDIAEMVDDIPF